MVHFHDRHDAGRRMADLLKDYRGQDVVVYALPRGGVVPALEIARALGAPLDLIIARKIGHPFQPEWALAAIAEDGDMIGNPRELEVVDHEWLEAQKQKQRHEAARRRELYLGSILDVPVRGKTAILVDDGIATGLTMRVGIKELRHRHPAKIVVAVPIAPEHTAQVIEREADELIAVEVAPDDEFLGAVGAYYDDFGPVEDEEVVRIMHTYHSKPTPSKHKHS